MQHARSYRATYTYGGGRGHNDGAIVMPIECGNLCLCWVLTMARDWYSHSRLSSCRVPTNAITIKINVKCKNIHIQVCVRCTRGTGYAVTIHTCKMWNENNKIMFWVCFSRFLVSKNPNKMRKNKETNEKEKEIHRRIVHSTHTRALLFNFNCLSRFECWMRMRAIVKLRPLLSMLPIKGFWFFCVDFFSLFHQTVSFWWETYTYTHTLDWSICSGFGVGS